MIARTYAASNIRETKHIAVKKQYQFFTYNDVSDRRGGQYLYGLPYWATVP